MQVVRFPNLPGVDAPDYLDAMGRLLQKIANEKPKERTLKRWMRVEGLLDKETVGLLESMFEFSLGGKVGKVAKRFIEADKEARQDLVFARFSEQNEILVKYVFDAIVERLYSTNELYRMLTSYVYPGKYIDLPDFTNWLNWMHATGRIRVLGIRWAPGDRFEASSDYIRSIDVDDILEEEAEEELLAAEAEEQADDEDEVEEATSATEAAAAPADPAPEPDDEDDAAADIGWEPPEDDSWDEDDEDEPISAPVAASGDQVAAIAALLSQSRQPALIDARLLDPIPQASALAAGVPLDRVKEALAGEPVAVDSWPESLRPTEEQMAENVRRLLEWWSAVEDRPNLRADQYELMPFGEDGWQDGTRARFLFKLTCLALSLHRGHGGEVAYAVLSGAKFYDRVFEGEGNIEQALDECFEQGLGQRPELFADLHLILMAARSLRGAESWCGELADLAADEVLAGLWKRLGAYSLHLPTLWVVRELSMFGILRQEELRTVRVVPSEPVRRAAFHLGLLESVRASTLPELLSASRRLSPLMELELEGPLLAFHDAYGAHPPAAYWSR